MVVVVEGLGNGEILMAPVVGGDSGSVVVVVASVVLVDLGAEEVGVVAGTDIVGEGVGTLPCNSRPGKDFTAGKRPPSMPGSLVDSCMKRLKMVAGKDPPLTFRPRTLVIFSALPDG